MELSRDELAEIAAKLPVRERRRFESEDKLQNLGADGKVEERIFDRERSEVAQRLETALGRALAGLPHEDRLLLRMWLQGISIAAISKRLGLAQRRLYTSRDKALRKLAADLEGEGLSAESVRDLLGWERLELRLGLGREENEEEPAGDGETDD